MRDFALRITGPNKVEIIDPLSDKTINLSEFNIVDIRIEHRPMERQVPPLVTLTLRVAETEWMDFRVHADDNLNTYVEYIDNATLRVENRVMGVVEDLGEYVRMNEVRVINVEMYNAEHVMIDNRRAMYLELPLRPKELMEAPEDGTSK